MASSGNFCVMNSLVKGTENVSSGNCKLDMTTNNRGALGNFEIPLTGKWYFECFAQMGSAVEGYVGISDIETDLQSTRGGYADSNMYGFGFSQYSGSNFFSIKVTAGSADNAGRIDEGTTNNAVLGIAINRDDDEIKLYTNNTLRFTLSISATTSYYPFFGVGGANNSSYFMYLNAGQDSTFGGNKTAGGNVDSEGFGDFFYSVPASHKALSSANLPISDDIDPAQTNSDYPTKQFGVVPISGNGSTQSITGLGFQPDLVWVKDRSVANENRLVDSSRGVNKALISNTTNAEVTDNGLTAFNSDGFSLSSHNNYNDSGDAYIGWCWRANGGTTASNTDGSITTTVQANTKAGFSIITYTGTGSNATIAHGLTKAPEFLIVKNLNDSDQWAIYHKTQTANYYTSFTASVFSDNNTFWNDTEPTTSVISIGTNNRVNGSGDSMVCYAWHSVEGFSNFGKFTGNGNNDGPYLGGLGFRPRLLVIKEDGADDWVVYDTARNTANTGSSKVLRWDSNAAEFDGTSRAVDILSNGFKIRTSNATINGSGVEYVYMAWADQSAKYSNAF